MCESSHFQEPSNELRVSGPAVRLMNRIWVPTRAEYNQFLVNIMIFSLFVNV